MCGRELTASELTTVYRFWHPLFKNKAVLDKTRGQRKSICWIFSYIALVGQYVSGALRSSLNNEPLLESTASHGPPEGKHPLRMLK